jgi:hypothetical protein
MPQATLLGAGHDGQHAPLVHVEPAAHIVPVPHVRQTVTPSVAISEGIAMPHGTVPAAGQLPQHTREVGVVVPGGFTHASPVGHMLPTPLHARHAGDGIAVPHITLAGAAQFGQHTPVMPPVQLMPEPQPIVP